MAECASISCLPREILLRVAELVEEPLDWKSREEGLKSFILVCRAWRDVGRDATSMLRFTCPRRVRDVKRHLARVLVLFPRAHHFVITGPGSLRANLGPIAEALNQFPTVLCLNLTGPLRACETFKLPGSIGRWTQLGRLSLGKSSGVRTLPSEVGNWQQLGHLNVSSCLELESLPAAVEAWGQSAVAGCIRLQKAAVLARGGRMLD